MAGRAMYRMFPALALMLAAPLSGCGKPEEPPLAGARIGGPFALTDQNGKTVRDVDFAGKYRIVYFGYTYCPDVCPTDMAKIGQAMKLLDKQAPRAAARIVPIFITVDPERDTPAVLGQFAANFDPRIVGLTGSAQAIAQVAKNYAVYFQKQPPGPGGGYMVDHVAIAYLMGPEGNPIASLPLEKGAEAIVEQVKHWVR
jgi:protein SCO1